MSWAIQSSFKFDLQLSLYRSIMQTPISRLTKNGFHASNQNSLLSEFRLRRVYSQLQQRVAYPIFLSEYSLWSSISRKLAGCLSWMAPLFNTVVPRGNPAGRKRPIFSTLHNYPLFVFHCLHTLHSSHTHYHTSHTITSINLNNSPTKPSLTDEY